MDSLDSYKIKYHHMDSYYPDSIKKWQRADSNCWSLWGLVLKLINPLVRIDNKTGLMIV